MNTILEVKNLRITPAGAGRPIVKDVGFSVRPGHVLGIVGESGSGKTMTCKAVMGLLKPDNFLISGSVMLRGTEISQMSERQMRTVAGKDISMIMQNPMTAFNPMMKIGGHIVETLRAHTDISQRDAWKTGVEALQKMQLCRPAQIMNSYPHTLSGGMLQRVMIAISLMLTPGVIIADEATTALDVSTQAMILDAFQKIRERGISLIVVTHDFGVVAQIADDVIVMRDGEVVENGTVCEIFYNPKAAYTKELLDARLLTNEGAVCFG